MKRPSICGIGVSMAVQVQPSGAMECNPGEKDHPRNHEARKHRHETGHRSSDHEGQTHSVQRAKHEPRIDSPRGY